LCFGALVVQKTSATKTLRHQIFTKNSLSKRHRLNASLCTENATRYERSTVVFGLGLEQDMTAFINDYILVYFSQPLINNEQYFGDGKTGII
jgi:hypothetical protein